MQIFDRPPEPPPSRFRPRLPTWRPPRPVPGLAMPGFARRPLTWLIAAEVVVCACFAAAALHLLMDAVPAASVAAPLVAPARAQPTEAPPDVTALLPKPGTVAPPGRPGLGRDGGFIGGVLSGLNADQASFERAEWTALQALSAGIRAYIEGVIVPAVEKAAHSAPRR